MKQIVCLSNEPWSPSPGRTQQLVARLKDVQVLYFSPAESWRDQRFRGKGRAVKPNITTYTLPPLLLPVDERYGELFQLGQRKLARYIAGKIAKHRFRAPLLWTTCPEQVHLLDRLDYDGLVYDCDREWDDLPPAWEGVLSSTADVVFAASQGLADRLSPCSSNIALLPNGTAYPLFAKAARPPEDRPPRRSAPTFGWAGTIHPDLDLSPVLHAAHAHPEWNFLLLGRREPNPLVKKLKRLPNVSFLPPLSPDGGARLSGPVPGADGLSPGGAAGQRRDPHPDVRVPVHRAAHRGHAVARPGGALPRRGVRGPLQPRICHPVRARPGGAPLPGHPAPSGPRGPGRLVGAGRAGLPHSGHCGAALTALVQEAANFFV